jgi:hypothetical protein
MKLVFDEVKSLSEVAAAKMDAAGSSIEQARVMADLGFECAALCAATVDVLAGRIAELEVEVKKLKGKAKKKK